MGRKKVKSQQKNIPKILSNESDSNLDSQSKINKRKPKKQSQMINHQIKYELIKLFNETNKSDKEIANRVGISPSRICLLRRQFQETNDIVLTKLKKHKTKYLFERQQQNKIILNAVKENPRACLNQIIDLLKKQRNVLVTKGTIASRLKLMGVNKIIINQNYFEIKNDEATIQQRFVHCQWIKTVNVEDIYYVDQLRFGSRIKKNEIWLLPGQGYPRQQIPEKEEPVFKVIFTMSYNELISFQIFKENVTDSDYIRHIAQNFGESKKKRHILLVREKQKQLQKYLNQACINYRYLPNNTPQLSPIKTVINTAVKPIYLRLLYKLFKKDDEKVKEIVRDSISEARQMDLRHLYSKMEVYIKMGLMRQPF